MAKPDLTAIFATDGRLSESIDGFQPRQAQVELAQAVAKTIDDDGLLVAEAGTGTGKTFAYLIPAILSGKKILVSTATKNLQQQLFSKDLPKLKKICQRYPKALLLKGRENYLCQARLELAPLQEALTKAEKQTLGKLQVWAANTKTGDLSECPGLNEQDSLWQKVCAKLEFCQANNCQKDSECFYPQRKVQATEADIIVVNHHLFCADLALREQGINELLPACEVYVFDEAHQLADIAAQFLGFNLSRFQLEELVRDIKEAQAAEAADSQDLVDRAQALQAHIKTLNATLGSWDKRWTWQELQATTQFMDAVDELLSHLQALNDQLSQLEKRGKRLASLARKTQSWVESLAHWIQSDDPTQVRWVESSQARFRLSLVPLNVDGPFNRQRAALGGSWIFTSATLSVQGQFDYFMHRLGVQKAHTLALASPFDYTQQGAIYHPVGLPDPKQADYIKICLRAVWPLLQLSGGRAFLLFTSFKALNEAKAILATHWDGQLLVQGEGDKNSLLEQFKQAQRAILLGTQSFWEGVDVKGEALQLVMIDRIPFSPPDDPIVQAREAYLKAQGLNGFAHFQLPEAIMNLKQGCGRLIRDTADRGVLVLCDPRLTQKGYGKRIRDSLPPFPWYEQPEPVKAFLAEQSAVATPTKNQPENLSEKDV